MATRKARKPARPAVQASAERLRVVVETFCAVDAEFHGGMDLGEGSLARVGNTLGMPLLALKILVGLVNIDECEAWCAWPQRDAFIEIAREVLS